MRVLSLDGGGMRGLFEALVLAALPFEPVRRFDVVAGTSTGGILALGLAAPGPTGTPRSAAELAELYARRGPEIFRGSPLAPVRQLVVSKYRRARLDEALREELGDVRLSAAATRVLVPAFSLAQRDIVWFDSRRAGSASAAGSIAGGGGTVKFAHVDPLVRDVAAATSAAPTYFDPARVEGLEGEWLDGGVGANDPAPFAIAVALAEGRDVVALSIGAGGFFPPYPRRLRGKIGIGVRSMPSLLLYPTGLVAHDTARALADAPGMRVRLFRIAPDPTRMPRALDDASPRALAQLRSEARRVAALSETQAAFAALAR